MELNKALEILEKCTKRKPLEYCRLEDGYFFVVETKPGLIQNAFYEVLDDGSVIGALHIFYDLDLSRLIKL